MPARRMRDPGSVAMPRGAGSWAALCYAIASLVPAGVPSARLRSFILQAIVSGLRSLSTDRGLRARRISGARRQGGDAAMRGKLVVVVALAQLLCAGLDGLLGGTARAASNAYARVMHAAASGSPVDAYLDGAGCYLPPNGDGAAG